MQGKTCFVTAFVNRVDQTKCFNNLLNGGYFNLTKGNFLYKKHFYITNLENLALSLKGTQPTSIFGH